MTITSFSWAQTAYWQDGFESYPAGASAPTPWYASGGGNVVTASQHYAGAKSLELDGNVGSCWASVCYRAIPITNSLYIECSIRPSGNHSQGCHPWAGLIGLTTTPDWTTAQGRWFLALEYSGQTVFGGYPGYAGTNLSTWSYDQWRKIGVLYQNQTTNVSLTYYIDGNLAGRYNFSVTSFENSLAYLGFDSGDGTTWIDNVSVSPGSGAPSVLSQIPNTNIIETVLWQYTPTVSGSGYSFGLSNAPSGMTVGASTGTISWTPTETQGPSTNANITYVVYQAGSPVAWTNFSVTVNEINAAPVLYVPGSQTVYATTTLTITNYATDSDIPANSLTFALASAPSGVSINPSTGLLTWTPPSGQMGTNTICVKVTDYNPWAVNNQQLSVTNCFTVVVNGLIPPTFTNQPVSQVIHSGSSNVWFCAAATGFPTPNYQWRFNGVNIPGATGSCFTLLSTSITNIGTYDVVAANSAGTNISSAVTLAFADLKMLASVYLTGPIGKSYRIDATPQVAPTNWTTLTNITITTQPFIYVDYTSATNRMQFYRAVPQ